MLRWEVQEGTSGFRLIHPPNSQQGQLEQVAQGCVQPDFEYFQGWKDSTICLDKALQCWVTPKVKSLYFLSSSAWGYSSPAAGLGISLCWIPRNSCWPISPACWCPPEWSHSHLVYQLSSGAEMAVFGSGGFTSQAQELFRWWIMLKMQSGSEFESVVLHFRYFWLFRGLSLGPSYVPVFWQMYYWFFLSLVSKLGSF